MSLMLKKVLQHSKQIYECNNVLKAVSCRYSGYSASNQRSESSSNGSLIGRNFLTLRDFTPSEIEQLLWTAKDLKTRFKSGELYEPLKGKSIAMIFQKRSTRTRISTETGMSLLGGHALFLSPSDIHLGVGESVSDSAKVLSGFCDLIFARVYGHEDLSVLAKDGSVPVINGLSDFYHPLQILADFLTLQEHFGHLEGLKIAFVGDGYNNMTHSFMMGCPKMGINLSVAAPKGYEADSEITQHALQLASEHKTSLKLTNVPTEAVEGAHVVVTDTWISMGVEHEKEQRMRDFAGYQVNRQMISHADPSWVFLHCLPRKQEEVDDDIFYDERSLVFPEAENRKWTVMSVMLHLLKDHVPSISKPTFFK